LRADAWRKTREAELEAVVNRSYDAMEIPEVAALMGKLFDVVAPIVEEFDRLVAELHRRVLQSRSAPFGPRLLKPGTVRKTGHRLTRCLSTKTAQVHPGAAAVRSWEGPGV
jgi:Mg2+ and Co2+ transporter CorA